MEKKELSEQYYKAVEKTIRITWMALRIFRMILKRLTVYCI